MRSIGKGVLSGNLCATTFDPKVNTRVTDWERDEILKLSQDGRLLKNIDHAGSKNGHFNLPGGLSASPESRSDLHL